jgi:hypothetical protein
MKSLHVLLAPFALVGASLSPCVAQMGSSLSLEVKPRAASASTDDQFKTSWGSYDKHYLRSRRIEISVRTLGQQPETVGARVYWIGSSVGGGRRSLLKEEAVKFTIDRSVGHSFVSSSGEVTGSDLNLELARYRSTSGDKIDGWVVAVEDPNTSKVIMSRASEPALAALLENGTLHPGMERGKLEEKRPDSLSARWGARDPMNPQKPSRLDTLKKR